MLVCLATAAVQHASCPTGLVAHFVTDSSGIHNASAEPSAWGFRGSRESHYTYGVLKFAAGSFGWIPFF
jgi:hypothetical protein